VKTYDLIVIGTGSAAGILDLVMEDDPEVKIALIDKDEPGGICLTRGCIPSKLLLYPAELLREVERASRLGIEARIQRIDFSGVMERMRASIGKEVERIRQGLSHHRNIDYFPEAAEFVSPFTLKVGEREIRGEKILLGTGSQPLIPPVPGLSEAGFLTSDTLLRMSKLPPRMAILGGGYIAAEYGHFFSAMGSKVTIIGRNPQFLPDEEPEISALARREMSESMAILTGHEVREVRNRGGGEKVIVARPREKGPEVTVVAEEILVAAGRAPTAAILHPERSGIRTTPEGWIEVNEYLETSCPNIWALGDANGKYPFKHKANYEAGLVYANAFLKAKTKVDYHAIPHAVFSHPEIASVGMKEREVLAVHGEEGVAIGLEWFEDTAKGEAMALKDYFVKVIVDMNNRILGAHIIGPQASLLIQEIITLMYTADRSARPITHGMHIHPALSEVVERAFGKLMPAALYHQALRKKFPG